MIEDDAALWRIKQHEGFGRRQSATVQGVAGVSQQAVAVSKREPIAAPEQDITEGWQAVTYGASE